MRYIYKWIGPATHQFMRYGGVAHYAIRKMQEKTLMASLRRRLKNQDEPALPRLPPCAMSTAIGAAPLAYLSICIAQR